MIKWEKPAETAVPERKSELHGGVIGLSSGLLHGAGPDAVADLSPLGHIAVGDEPVRHLSAGLHAGGQDDGVAVNGLLLALGVQIGDAVLGDALAAGGGDGGKVLVLAEQDADLVGAGFRCVGAQGCPASR